MKWDLKTKTNLFLGLSYSLTFGGQVELNLNFLVMGIAFVISLPIAFSFIFYDRLESIFSSVSEKMIEKSGHMQSLSGYVVTLYKNNV